MATPAPTASGSRPPASSRSASTWNAVHVRTVLVTRTTGSVTAASATSITVTPNGGSAQTFTVNSSTRISPAGTNLAALPSGSTATVASRDGTTATAVHIHKQR